MKPTLGHNTRKLQCEVGNWKSGGTLIGEETGDQFRMGGNQEEKLPRIL